MVFGQALAVFQAFSLAKLQNLRLLSQELKFWESLYNFCKNYGGIWLLEKSEYRQGGIYSHESRRRGKLPPLNWKTKTMVNFLVRLGYIADIRL
jgi:hypothetical protein